MTYEKCQSEFFGFIRVRQQSKIRYVIRVTDDSEHSMTSSAINSKRRRHNHRQSTEYYYISDIGILLSRRSRQRERLSASMLSICLFVCLSSKCKKNAIFSKKTKQFTAMVSIDDL